MAEQRSWKKR